MAKLYWLSDTEWALVAWRPRAAGGIPLPPVPHVIHGLKTGAVDRWVHGETDASDHAPVWIELTLPSRARGPLPP
jgi:hypothetical protein